MKNFKKLALLCTAILACGVMATTTGCALFEPIPDEPTSESSSSSSEIPETTKFTIKFVNDDGTVLQESVVEAGELPAYTGATPTKAATAQYTYAFAGWDATIVEATADVVYTATFTQTVNNYVVSFDVDGGSAVDAQTVPYGTSASELASLTSTKVGYDFAGWTLADGSEIPAGATVTGNITVKAKWDIITYSAKVVRADGTEQTVSFNINDRASVLAGIALTADDAQYSYAWVSAIPTELALNNEQVFTETRTVNNYTVTFDVNGGSAVEAQTVPYGTSASALANFSSTKDGYMFAGWTFEDGSAIPAEATVTGNITVKAKWTKGSIYGTGITVTATSETGVVEVKAFEDGENAGYTRTYVSYSGGNYGTIAVRADASAGLKANTSYKVLLTVEVDGNFPAFFDHDANSFIIGQPGGVITVDVMTNENGELEWVDRVYYNEGSYVDFVSVAIAEDHGSVYGAGVTVTGTGSAVGAETKFYTEGEKAGYTRTYFTYSYCDHGTFTVAADASAGLKANTTYEVIVTYEMDAEFPAIFNADVTFSLSKSEGVLTFEITTDANGAFNQTWGGIVWNAGTYLDVVGVSFTEKVEKF